ncbi:MAG: hypothetical protein ABSB25_09230 [Sedimentisphaerales bacterium]|jgi:hypothetical protein
MKTLRAAVLVLCCLAAGCNAGDPFVFLVREGPPINKQIYAQYQQTTLKQSTSAEVLSRFVTLTPKDALLSQSKSIAAIAGTTKFGHKMWFNIVTFDESELIAKRKYYFISHERPKQLFVEPWEGVDFGCQMVLSKETLEQPYADENARRIAVLKKVDADTRKDTMDIGADNATLSLSGMMAGQGMESLLVKLNASPALAARLSEPNGLEFDHINLDKGKLRMVIDNDIVTVKMRLGSFGKEFKVSFEDLNAMDQ